MVLGVGRHGGPEAGRDKRRGQCCAPPVLINLSLHGRHYFQLQNFFNLKYVMMGNLFGPKYSAVYLSTVNHSPMRAHPREDGQN